MTHLLATGLLAKSGSGGGGSPIGFLVIIGIFAVVYLVFLRPRAAARRRAAGGQRGQASVGDRVTTTAGLIATVVAIDDDEVILEIAPGVHCRYLPAAIGRIMNDPEPAESEPTDDAAAHDEAEPHSAVVDEPTDT
jgi:preprotein translocase subunit YajC